MKTPRLFALLTLAAIGAHAPAASAQIGVSAGSIIYWRTVTTAPRPSNHFRFLVNSTNSMKFLTYPTDTGNPSSFSAYPLFGRVYFVDERLDPARFGTIPIIRKPMTVLRLASERQTAELLTLTNFFGPEYIEQAIPRWSSEGQDSFFSFQAYVPRTNLRKVYRFSGSKSVFFSPLFRPFVPNDPRLTEIVSFSPDSFTNDWNSTGLRLMFSTPAPFGVVTRIRDLQVGRPTVVNDPAVSGFSLKNPVFSPTNPDIAFSIAETPGGLRGIAAFNVMTQAFGWILLEGNVLGTLSTNFTDPQVSPDGRSLAFTLHRTIRIGNVTGPAVTLARVSVTGGGLQPLFTVGHNATNSFEVTGWTPAP